jgi:hypothetical protein
VGFLVLNTAVDAVGNDLLNLGMTLHLDLLADPNVPVLPAVSGASGDAQVSVPLPPKATLAGFQVFGQAIWPWNGACTLGFPGLSSSNALGVTLRTL